MATFFDEDDMQSGFNVQEQPFSSTWLQFGTWNADNNYAEIRFKGGYIWKGNLSLKDWAHLKAAASPGRTWHAYMRRGIV